jgi:hypothetical protein
MYALTVTVERMFNRERKEHHWGSASWETNASVCPREHKQAG